LSETTERQIEIILTSGSPDATRDIAARLGVCLRAGDVVALSGELGAGKTCFVQGLAKGMGLQANVTSPTFILIRQHPGDPALCHADAYRLESPEELEDLGLEDILAYSVLAIEWAERVMDALPEDRIDVALSYADGEGRRVRITGCGERSARLVREAFK